MTGLPNGNLIRHWKNTGIYYLTAGNHPQKTNETEQASSLAQFFVAIREYRYAYAEINPQLLLQGDNPRLIDEWQLAPSLWDTVRFEVDHRKQHGLFILTGSAVPSKGEQKETKHSGTGRFAWLTMRPMSLWESKESDGSVSLSELFNQPAQIAGINKLSIQDLAFLTCRGGWPEAIDMTGDDALGQAFDYFDAVVNRDISRVDGVQRDPERAKLLMRSYARHQGTLTTNPCWLQLLAREVRTACLTALQQYPQ